MSTSKPNTSKPGNVTNLNQFRKQKARAAKRTQGDENAVKFGRTKAEKTRERAQKEHNERRLDGHKRDDT